jgi:hypothetical protein
MIAILGILLWLVLSISVWAVPLLCFAILIGSTAGAASAENERGRRERLDDSTP